MGRTLTGRLGAFFDWFLGLFSRADGPEAAKRRMLKQISRAFAKTRVKIYKPQTDEILPALPRFIYEIYKTVFPAQSLFKSIQNPNAWKTLVINASMSEKLLDLTNRLTAEAILEQAGTVELPELEQRVKADLDSFLLEFNEGMTARIDGLYTKLMRFNDFCAFDFYALLKKFAPKLKEGTFAGLPDFNILGGQYVVDSIREFAAAAWPITSFSTWDDLFDALKGQRNFDRVPAGGWTKTVSRIDTIKKSGAFEMMIQLILKDPDFILPVKERQERIVDSYIEKIQEEAEDTLAQLHAQERADRIETLAAQVFGADADIQLKNYTDGASEEFLRRGLEGYAFCKPLGYLKAFLLSFVKHDLSEVADLVLVRGKWADPSLAAPLSNSFHSLLELDEKITALEDSLEETAPRGIKLNTMIFRVERDRGSRGIVQGIIKDMNNQARDIITFGAQELITAARQLKLLLEDYEKSAPEIFANWKEVEHYADRPIKGMVVEVYKKIYLFVQLMQTFFD
ncbi:MAG: hypothetical protein LBR23_06650 [Spirochaetaceae bacterium]|jgi:hypothetical protein|nr:hypothetical protein [Spirochaetaceae bacterium]